MAAGNIHAEIGARVRAARKAADLSQTALASQLSVSSSVVSRWESGEIALGLDSLVQLSEVLGKRLEWFMSKTPDRSAEGPGEEDAGAYLRSVLRSLESITATLQESVRALREREQTERERIAKVESPQAEAYLLAQRNIERTLEQLATLSPHAGDRNEAAVGTRESS